MQTLRKKTSPLKYKNETTRFLGDGVSFKAKLIGILEVSEARGDRMCQEALSDLKMAIRAAGEHKQRITINIAIDGLRLRDEKTGDSLYHHPVHKISFIAQDMTDSRAFGYIFGSPDTGHRFFGIKTDKAASQVVIAMRDLFQVVFALKKKEIELAKQQLEKSYYPTSPLFSDSSSSSSKLQSLPNAPMKSSSEAKASSTVIEQKNSGTAVADLVDLELELNSLQQGLNQMEKITPSDSFGSKDDPFGDSFISYSPRPILPPPPSSDRSRSSRFSEASSVFSPKTPHIGITVDTDKKDFSFSHDISDSHDEPSSGDWFTPSAGNSIFEDTTSLPEPSKDEKHELTKQEILSQFDVFTELDPLGTGRSKPYIDRKHFFQELKNPPKKVLNDLVARASQDQPLFNTSFNETSKTQNDFSLDPFGEDPFVKEDPFAGSDFSKQDPFESELCSFKKENVTLFQSGLSVSPKNNLEKQMSLLSTSPNTKTTTNHKTFDTNFDRLAQFHDNASLEISSESECAPEPPPRPTNQLVSIKPPPLPPKKSNEIASKPPPRPPYHSEESPYEFLGKYESGPSSILGIGFDKGPALPVPQRKTKFEMEAPDRPKKHLNASSEEDYLAPISVQEKPPEILLPPQKTTKINTQVNISSFLDSKTNNLQTNLEGLDITLSQLTLSGLNELAQKLKIPTTQLSNMTLVQLTNFLSNFIKSNNSVISTVSEVKSEIGSPNNFANFSNFEADFGANFNNSNSADPSYDRYAVFRELIQEEIKQTKIDSEPEEILEEKEKLENSMNSNVNLDLKPLTEESSATDRYAALREIVESELKQTEETKEDLNQNHPNDTENKRTDEENIKDAKLSNGTLKETKNLNIINHENNHQTKSIEKALTSPIKTKIIDYISPPENNVKGLISVKTTLKSPVKSNIIKSPVPSAITEIVQNNTRLTSGSLSDVISGSSPEVDNTASNSDIGKKVNDATGESWAIFDQESGHLESVKEKQTVQSEEGVSPWSSDSKEFGAGSPPGWRSKDSGSGTEPFPRKRRDQDGWWDTAAEPEAHYYCANRRSTDSYDEEYYECYDRPRRRRQQSNWQHGNQATGGHSSSSRDVSPWEEEPRRRELRELRDPRTACRHPRTHSFERRRERRLTDSWDEDDDYEYGEENSSRHWPDRHSSRETDRESRHSAVSREHDTDRWCDDRSDDRRHRRRRDPRERDSRDRWCCPDWEQSEHEKTRFGSGRWRDHMPDDRYYSRESQESPWEDEYSNEPEESPHFVPSSSKRNWKRPSSASEMDRKTGEIKSRHHTVTGGSDGERDRRYKSNRRSRSRDSQYSEPPHRHKPDIAPSLRATHRNKPYIHSKTVDGEFPEAPIKKMPESKIESTKKPSSLSRKKTKECLKIEDNASSTFPRKSTSRGKLFFENDFVSPESSPVIAGRLATKINFEGDLEKPSPNESIHDQPRPTSKLSLGYMNKQKSHFEDDFSPGDKLEQEDNIISSIKEEVDREDEDEFVMSNFEATSNGRKKFLSKNRFSGSLRSDVNLKKSESVNIFAREDDPFDDDFFCGEDFGREQKTSPRSTELKWTDDFEN